jgi:sialate O-acetylesterase
MRFAFLLVVAVLTGSARLDTSCRLEVASLFSDNMVLQQKSSVPFWGRGVPGDRVTVAGSWGESVATVVEADSLWRIQLRTSGAGGPHEVLIGVGDTTIRCRNVMLGEVWVCSGQSNMELALEGSLGSPVLNSAEAIASARYPDIRLFTVGRAFSARPESNCDGSWSECSPTTAAKFSAVAYSFGKRLYDDLHVPIGLINASWGGTYLQSWANGKVLASLPDYREQVQRIEALQVDIDRRNRWIRSHPSLAARRDSISNSRDNLSFGDGACSTRDFDDRDWETMPLPAFWWETPLRDFDGVVWFRKTVTIPRMWINVPLVVHLGRIHGMDETWVNGTRVGGLAGAGYWSVPRVYDVPQDVAQDTMITIAVRIVDIDSGGETWGDGSDLKVHLRNDTLSAVTLAGEWKYLPVAEYVKGSFYVYGATDREFYSRPGLPLDLGPNTPTALYNGMIAPIIPFGIKGVIWYQGESNADTPNNYNNYRYHFPLLIKNWRDDWGEGNFPFYWVQIAPWNYWPKWNSYMIRDAQRRTLAVPNTGMAVTLDIGSLASIHPPNKHDVGARLALWALARQYGKRVVYSGPLYESMRVRKGKAILSFTHNDGGLVVRPIKGRTNFIIAGPDSNFVDAEVRVSGKTLDVFSPKVKHPVAVRYAWGNTEEATLFNGAGLPASTFRTDDWSQ